MSRTRLTIAVAATTLIVAGLLLAYLLAAPPGPLDPNPRLREVFARTTRIEILTLRESVEFEYKLVGTVRDAADVAALANAIRVAPALGDAWFHCECDGDPLLRLYEGESMLTEITIHHGRTIGWRGEFATDFELVADTREQLAAVLASLGMPESTSHAPGRSSPPAAPPTRSCSRRPG